MIRLLLAVLGPGLLVAREAVEGHEAMVVSAHHLASRAGAEIMRQGGNAIDGAVATGFALAVVQPGAGNLGGGGFMIVHTWSGKAVAIDFRERAPAAATQDMFLDEEGNAVAARSRQGYLASGVPGTVAGFAHAWGRYGSGRIGGLGDIEPRWRNRNPKMRKFRSINPSGPISWSEVIEPARRLAANGFAVSPALAQQLRMHESALSGNAQSRRIFLRNGDLHRAGEIFRQPDLAATLTRIQEQGAREFYHGQTADLIAADQAGGGGLITRDDLAAYRPIEREVMRGHYRGHSFLTMPPPSSGGIALVQMLGMLERHDLRNLGLHSAAYVHTVIEAQRRAFHDRALYLGDPDFQTVPQDRLIDAAYLARRMHDFDPARATVSAAMTPGLAMPSESDQTTHFSVVDAAGNAVACTTTLNGHFGNKVTVAGAGFLLNNEMDDFTAKMGTENMFGLRQSEINAIEPGKRPLSSMTPTIVLKDDRPYLVLGSRGGPTIITTVLQVILNVIDHQLPLTLAVDAPRFHHQWQPDHLFTEPFFATPDTRELLEQMGHRFALGQLQAGSGRRPVRYMGDVEGIMVEPGSRILLGVTDHRNADARAAGF